jgi:hypothetical protein
MSAGKVLLDESKELQAKDSLANHVETIKDLRNKNYSWREVAASLKDLGVETDHSTIFRFMKNWKGDGNNYVDFFVPTADEYVQALLESPVANPTTATAKGQRAMLLFHYRAHNRTVTYTQLAQAAGSDHYQKANRFYGNLGDFLGIQLEMNFARSGKTGEPFHSSAIGMDNPFKSAKQEYQLVMHHELAKAIEKLGWANLNDKDTASD